MTDTAPPRRSFVRDEGGFTLLELLVVIAILGLLAAIVAPQVLRYLGSSRSQTASVQIRNISSALELYRLDATGFPTNEQGLQALVKPVPGMAGWNGPYMPKASALTDPWGRPYLYKNPGEHGEVDVYSLGSDNAVGGTGEAKDIGNW
jgi:general secretion pathway protein G